jgi:starch phosphorylase
MTANGFVPYLPDRLRGLASLALNLWWSWHPNGRGLFRSIDPTLWARVHRNPLDLLHRVAPERLDACANDPEYLELYDSVMRELRGLDDRRDTWFATTHPEFGTRPVVFFCAEFGLHHSLPVYSGGLGVLAGDMCKAASDLGIPFVAVGLFYVKGYFDQQLRPDGWQEATDDIINRSAAPVVQMFTDGDNPAIVSVRCGERDVNIGVWRVMVGRVPVYLLDTDLWSNHPDDRELTGKLYAGNHEMRLRQEWILGVGGVRVLRALGLDPMVWHANEGHVAFMFVERLRELARAGVPLDEAVRRIRATSVFTTHTPVPAGHDTFQTGELERVAGPVWKELGLTREQFFGLGHHPAHDGQLFHVTVAAIRFSQRVNAVAARHERESRRLWHSLWKDREAEQVPIRHVTNGVHMATWMVPRIRDLLRRELGPDWERRVDEPGFWHRVNALDPAALWHTHERLRHLLHNYIREEARARWRYQWKDPAKMIVAGTLLSPGTLTIGFARRFASYKRADLLLRDPERLRRLLVNPRRPVELIFAGKAHPADDPGKAILQKVYNAAQDPKFEGRIAFLEDYEMDLARRLVAGVDVWLNMPRVPLEACGTSGMKAALNAVPQISTLDGWWAEGYNGTNGWAVPLPGPDQDPDEHDAEHLFTLLEEQVVPRYYERDAHGLPQAWIQTMKNALRTAGECFTARRMLQQYVTEYYVPAAAGSEPDDDPPTA